MNGSTSLSHAPGSLTFRGSVGRHCRPVRVGKRERGFSEMAVLRRAAIIDHAAASPVAIPPRLAGPSSIAASAAV